MCRVMGRVGLVLVLVALFAIAVALPGEAAYTKLYSFNNGTGVYQSSVKATTVGLELITGSYVFPGAWAPAKISYGMSSGVYGTRIVADGPVRPPTANVKLGWRTSDRSCRLRDLRWGTGQAIYPTQLQGIPGGGMVFYDYPDPGCLTVVITNDLSDPNQVLSLSDIEFAVSGCELNLEELDSVLGSGFVELRVARIDEDIDVILAEIAYHESLGELAGPSANSLTRKLERAASYKHDGLDEYLAGNLDKALFAWDKAAHQVENFISEVTAAGQKGNLPLSLYERWVVDGGGEIAPAPEIMDGLLALPEGEVLQSLAPLPQGTPLPAYPGLDPGGYVQWPVTELYPGEYTAFVVCDLDLGSGFIMGGSVLDAGRNVVLDWLEQSVAEPGVIDTKPPKFIGAPTTPSNLWPPDHSMIEMALDVTLEDDSYAVWYVAGVASNQPVLGTGDGDYAPDWVTDTNDPQSLWLRSERSGNHPEETRWYTITLEAIDTGGNISEPFEVYVPVSHDQG